MRNELDDSVENNVTYAQSLACFLGDMMLYWYGCTTLAEPIPSSSPTLDTEPK